jgi:NTE family protein
LRDIVAETIDVSRIGAASPVRLYLGALAVRTGRLRVFTGDEVGLDAIAAATVDPRLFAPVEIAGEPFCNASPVANPALFPLLGDGLSPDILLICTTPMERDPPATVSEIEARIAEISANTVLVKELHHIGFVAEQIRSGLIREEAAPPPRLHAIADDMGLLANLSLQVGDGGAIGELFEAGRRGGARWIEGPACEVGHSQTVDPFTIFAP